MKIKTFLVGVVGFFLLLSCYKDPPKLPDETQDGLQTFGCLVNGELVISRDSRGKPIAKGSYDSEKNQFRLRANTEHEHYGNEFDFFVTQPKLGLCTIDSVFFRVNNRPYYYVARNVQQINFTRFDVQIASGTFSFEANAYDGVTHEIIPNQKITVNKGRFDVPINSY